MITYHFYNDSFYERVIVLLKEVDLYDDVWETRENLKRKIEKDPESILIACDEDMVVGCVFIVEDGWNAFIWRLSVLQSYQNQGIGTQLMKKAENIISGRGLKEVSLFVDVTNESLIKWYQDQEYITARDWKFMYKKLDN
jgi:ribosomal protein S18 acetylase RimI-like enzyme